MFYEECENLAKRHPDFMNIIEKLDKKLSSLDSTSILDAEIIARFFKEEINDISIILEKLYQLDLLFKDEYYHCSCGNLLVVKNVNETLIQGDVTECSICSEEITTQMEVKTVYRLKPDKVLKIINKVEKVNSDKIPENLENTIGVVVALDIELEAVRRQNEFEPIVNDSRTYYYGKISSSSGSYDVVIVKSSHMGNTPAAIVTKDLIRDWNPKYIMLLGIAAGYNDNGLKFGDLVISDTIFDYDYTKEFDDKTNNRPRVFNSDHYLLERIKSFISENDIEYDLSDGSSCKPSIMIGHIATGNKVIASTNYKEKIKNIHDKIIAIEMESGGVADAAKQLKTPIGILVIKGISDMGDDEKDDDWHNYCAEVAAKFFFDFLRSGSI